MHSFSAALILYMVVFIPFMTMEIWNIHFWREDRIRGRRRRFGKK
jgi:hypothetical protein